MYILEEIWQLSGQIINFKQISLLSGWASLMFPKALGIYIYTHYYIYILLYIYYFSSYIFSFTGCLPFIASYSGVPFVIVIQRFLLKINTANPIYYVTLYN